MFSTATSGPNGHGGSGGAGIKNKSDQGSVSPQELAVANPLLAAGSVCGRVEVRVNLSEPSVPGHD